MKIKICGMKYEENIVDIAAMRPDMMGFIFYPKSKRFMESTLNDVTLERLSGVKKVGVFVNESVAIVLEIASRYGLDVLQLHGEESIEYCALMKDNGYEVIKAIAVDGPVNFNRLKHFANTVDLFLFDSFCASYGGSGHTFNIELLKGYDLETPFLLSGGLGNNNIASVLHSADLNPKCIGIDANSKLEVAPGFKNVKKVNKFINTIRNATI